MIIMVHYLGGDQYICKFIYTQKPFRARILHTRSARGGKNHLVLSSGGFLRDLELAPTCFHSPPNRGVNAETSFLQCRDIKTLFFLFDFDFRGL